VYSLLLSCCELDRLCNECHEVKERHTLFNGCTDILFFTLLTQQNTVHYWTTFASKYRPTTNSGVYNSCTYIHFADYSLHDRVVYGNLRNMLISADQSQRVSQITLSQFRISQITRSRNWEVKVTELQELPSCIILTT